MPGEGSGILMDEEAVNALKKLATDMPEVIDCVKQAADLLESSFDDKRELLGPHTNEIHEILDCINDAQNTGRSSVVKVQTGVIRAAARLSAVLAKSLGVKKGP